jgi:hypothetical protein
LRIDAVKGSFWFAERSYQRRSKNHPINDEIMREIFSTESIAITAGMLAALCLGTDMMF